MYRDNKKNLKIKTPFGWENFSGILKGEEKKGFILQTEKEHIEVSESQPLLTQRGFVKAVDITLNDVLYDSSNTPLKVTNKVPVNLESVYDIIETQTHTVVVNNIVGHQCDEFAHVKPSIQDKFWTSINPTLSTGGRCLIASTPNGDSDLFATLWQQAIVKEKEGTLAPEKRDFIPYFVKWDAIPGRDEEFKKQEIAKMGPTKWAQEYECLERTTKVTININDEIKTVTLEELEQLLCM